MRTGPTQKVLEALKTGPKALADLKPLGKNKSTLDAVYRLVKNGIVTKEDGIVALAKGRKKSGFRKAKLKAGLERVERFADQLDPISTLIQLVEQRATLTLQIEDLRRKIRG
jgi:hypothetical protein